MSMTEYLRKVKQQLRDTHGFRPSGGTQDDPIFDSIPDGEYPMTIEDQTDRVRIDGGLIHCCNFD